MTFILIAIVTMALSLWAAARVKMLYNRYNQLPVRSGLSGAQVAAEMLAGLPPVALAASAARRPPTGLTLTSSA